MKKTIVTYILVFFIAISIYAENNPMTFFNAFDKSIDEYLFQSFDINSQLSEGQILIAYSNGVNTVYRIELFSSMGKTIYTSYYELNSNLWFIEKKALFYDIPFNVSNADLEISYFKYDDRIFKYDKKTNLYIQGLDIDSASAVVDFRTAEGLIALILETINVNELFVSKIVFTTNKGSPNASLKNK